jgi:hypothetical protein
VGLVGLSGVVRVGVVEKLFTIRQLLLEDFKILSRAFNSAGEKDNHCEQDRYAGGEKTKLTKRVNYKRLQIDQP